MNCNPIIILKNSFSLYFNQNVLLTIYLYLFLCLLTINFTNKLFVFVTSHYVILHFPLKAQKRSNKSEKLFERSGANEAVCLL